MANFVFERFNSPASMMEAEQELLSLGDAAVPLLASLLAGTSKNEFGVPYRDMGLPLQCALEVAKRLGSKAKPLEPLICQELKRGHSTAAMALGSLDVLEEASIVELANSLRGHLQLASESAAALVKHGQNHAPCVLEVTQQSSNAAKVMAMVGHT